jgi:hypothetical protein
MCYPSFGFTGITTSTYLPYWCGCRYVDPIGLPCDHWGGRRVQCQCHPQTSTATHDHDDALDIPTSALQSLVPVIPRRRKHTSQVPQADHDRLLKMLKSRQGATSQLQCQSFLIIHTFMIAHLIYLIYLVCQKTALCQKSHARER